MGRRSPSDNFLFLSFEEEEEEKKTKEEKEEGRKKEEEEGGSFEYPSIAYIQ